MSFFPVNNKSICCLQNVLLIHISNVFPYFYKQRQYCIWNFFIIICCISLTLTGNFTYISSSSLVISLLDFVIFPGSWSAGCKQLNKQKLSGWSNFFSNFIYLLLAKRLYFEISRKWYTTESVIQCESFLKTFYIFDTIASNIQKKIKTQINIQNCVKSIRIQLTLVRIFPYCD